MMLRKRGIGIIDILFTISPLKRLFQNAYRHSAHDSGLFLLDSIAYSGFNLRNEGCLHV